MDDDDFTVSTVSDVTLEFELKEEILDECFEEEENLETVSNYYEAKCGNVFISNSGKYSFVCEFCNDRFYNMESFGYHLKEKHLNYDFNETTPIEILTDLKIEFDELDQGDLNEHVGGNCIEYVDVAEVATPVNDGKLEGSIESCLFDDSNLCCLTCKRQFRTKSSFSRHKNRHKYRHIIVSPNSNDDDSVKRNIEPKNMLVSPTANTKPNDPSLFCNLCDRHFKTSQAFNIHAVCRHGNEIPKSLQDNPTYLKCRYCHMEFERALERANHESNHTEEKPFRCPMCPKSFRVKYQRDIHENSHTGAHPYQCSLCPKAFTTLINRVQHIRGHLGIKRFTCEYCGKKFITNVQRSIHTRIHTHEKPYQCEQCGERFRVSGRLFAHRKRHANKRDCKCDVCGKSFFSNEAVKHHKVRHSNERPYKCPECGKTFQRRKTLVAHQQLHAPEKTYECSICGRKFAQCAGLNSHMKTHGEKLKSF